MEYYLCILDFEATCWKSGLNKDEMEIIEFPSILYKIKEKTKTIEFISEFSQYVKPTINPILTKFCTELTGITQETVNASDTFDIVYKNHQQWLSNHIPKHCKLIFATCGNWDLNTQLPRELKNKKLDKHKYYSKFINVKSEFNYFYDKNCKGMTDMLKKLNIPLEGKHHSGIDDSRNIAKIMIKMIQDGHKYDNFYFKTVSDISI